MMMMMVMVMMTMKMTNTTTMIMITMVIMMMMMVGVFADMQVNAPKSVHHTNQLTTLNSNSDSYSEP